MANKYNTRINHQTSAQTEMNVCLRWHGDSPLSACLQTKTMSNIEHILRSLRLHVINQPQAPKLINKPNYSITKLLVKNVIYLRSVLKISSLVQVSSEQFDTPPPRRQVKNLGENRSMSLRLIGWLTHDILRHMIKWATNVRKTQVKTAGFQADKLATLN